MFHWMLKKQNFARLAFIILNLISFSLASAQKVYFALNELSVKSPIYFALQDARGLLKNANATMINSINEKPDWVFQFELNPNENLNPKNRYDRATKDEEAFSLQTISQNNRVEINIKAISEKGLANGLYYFLQNYLGFQFYHPKETFIPANISVELPTIDEKVIPRFDKMGFHIHAMHPLELTEALLDANFPNGEEEVQNYITWLCRNGQNYFEFNLLSSIDFATWIPYMRKIIAFAHERGILMGADLSMNMIQQRALQLYKNAPHSFESKQNQMVEQMELLTRLDWDVWNVEFATTEFTHKNQDKLYQQQLFLYNQLHPKNIHLTGRKHVVKDENLISGEKSAKKTLTDMDSAYGVLVHTVMFYGLLDEKTPVYRNKDFAHLRTLLIESNQYRDTWYFPESAYWITFDNSVPMFLTSYLNARLEDILFCDSVGVTGHLTFTSGWEWNYWLIDWSIARWSWKSDKTTQKEHALQYIQPLITDSIYNFVEKAAALQQLYIKDKELIKVLTAQTVTDEIPGPLNLELHPRPEFPYSYIRNKASSEEIYFVQNKYIEELKTFVRLYQNERMKVPSPQNKVEQELINSLDITCLRAAHRLQILQYLVAVRKNKINKTKEPTAIYLENAAEIRQKALQIVEQQEINYRYPVQLLAHQRKSKTVYNFGYLYTVHNLHFWEREELQAKNNRWNFWYRNIWDVFKIIGVKS